MANYLILKRVEQLKLALEQSVDVITQQKIIADYDIQVKNKRTGQVGYAKTYKDDPKTVCFIVASEGGDIYDISRREFDSDFELTLNKTINELKTQECVVCVICRHKEHEEIEVESYRGKPYTCHDCIEQLEYA